MMFTSRLGSEDPIVELTGCFLAELTFFGRSCQFHHPSSRQSEAVQRYCARREVPIRTLVAVLEEKTGLRFDDANLPYRYDAATWPTDQPLAGHTGDNPDLKPGQWLAAVFSNWKAIAHSEAPERTEMYRVLRSALWVCHRSGVTAALRYVLDLVQNGQVLDVRAAAWGVSRVLIASSRTPDPEQLVSRLMDGGVPDTPRDWLAFTPGEDCWLEPAHICAEARAGLESLVEHGWALVGRARSATTLDDWLSAILAVHGSLMFIADVIRLTLGEPPTEVAALLSQFEELWCDVGTAIVCLEIGEQAGMGVRGFVEYERGLEQQFRDAGDRTGQRFRRERLLLPAGMMDGADTQHWTMPSWRIGIPWIIGHTSVTDPREFVPDMATAYQHYKDGETALTRSVLDDVLRQRPWNDAVYWLYAMTYQSDGDQQAALDSTIPMVALRPEHHETWELLGRSLDALGRRQSAAITLLMYAFSLDRAGQAKNGDR
jgi:hypothetical protein